MPRVSGSTPALWTLFGVEASSWSHPIGWHVRRSWAVDAADLARRLPDETFDVVAGSNGCSTALRLAIDVPHRVDRLVLCWPATQGQLDNRLRDVIERDGPPGAATTLLAGGTLRGVADAELSALTCPLAVLPSEPENPIHLRRTVDEFIAVVPGSLRLPGTLSLRGRRDTARDRR